METRLALCISISAVLGVAGRGQEVNQGQKRGLVRCTARQVDGRPWAGAEVVFVSRAIATHAELEGADVVRARTNERGVARARLQPGRGYSCWALGPAARDARQDADAYRRSQVVEDVRAGDALRLKATEPVRKRYHTRIRGLETWKTLAPFTVRVVSTGPMNVYQETIQLDAEGKFRMPSMPGPSCFVQVFGKGMYPIHQEPVPIDAGTWALARKYRIGLQEQHALKGLDPGEAAGTYLVPIPPPAMARVFVKDLTEKGIADAKIFRDPNQSRAPWYRVAKTDAEGHATFPIPVYRRKDGSGFALHLDLLARAKGHADGWAPKEGLQFDKEGGTTELALQLAPGHTGRGSLLIAKDQPLADQELILFSSVQRGKGGGQIGIGPYRFRTDKDGSFHLHGRSANYVWRLCTLLSPRQIGSLGWAGRYPTAPLVWLASREGKTETEVALRLDRFIPVDFQILGRDGSPDPDARIWLGEVENGGKAPHYPLRYRPNRLGRLRILLAPGSSVLVYVRSPRGAALQQVDVPKDAPRTGWPQEISLAQSRALRGRVLDTRGGVAQDAFLRVSNSNFRKEGQAWRTLFNWRTMAMLSNSSEKWAYEGRELHPNRTWRSRQWIYFAHPSTQVSCNDKGEFELWLPDLQESVSLQAVQLSRGKWLKSPVSQYRIHDLTDDPVEIVIQD